MLDTLYHLQRPLFNLNRYRRLLVMVVQDSKQLRDLISPGMRGYANREMMVTYWKKLPMQNLLKKKKREDWFILRLRYASIIHRAGTDSGQPLSTLKKPYFRQLSFFYQ